MRMWVDSVGGGGEDDAGTGWTVGCADDRPGARAWQILGWGTKMLWMSRG